MKKIKLFLALLLVSLSFISCDPNDNDSKSNSNDPFAENFGNSVNRDFIGQVVDASNNPIQTATVQIGGKTIQTDANGVFIINDADVYEKFAYIKVKKSGYIDGSRSMVPTSGKNNIKIMLVSNAPLQTVQSGVESEVSIYSGTKVKFDGFFQDENGNAYSGAVQVSMFHLTTSDENLSSLMPGMLYAERENGDAASLETFGMLNVELRGSGGQKLNIAKNHTAEITMRIDDSQLASSPSSIPLWHFDEQGGYWKEDGEATKVGNNYVGNVSHFSWWNCDIPNSSILLTFNLVETNGNPLSNVYINLSNSDNYHAYGTTDSNGQLSGMFPANEVFALIISSNSNCPYNYSDSIGPYTSDTIVPTITIDLISNSTVTSQVVGTLLKCDNTNVTNGYILLIKNGYHHILPVTNGIFELDLIYCYNDTAFGIQGVDYDNAQETTLFTYDLMSPVTNIGNIQACTNVSQFISYQVDNNPTRFHYLNLLGSTGNPPTTPLNSFYVYGQDSNTNGISIIGNTNLTGNYTTSQFSIYGQEIGNINSTTTNNVQFHLNQVGPVGNYLDMTFTGSYNDSIAVQHTITGTVHVIRDN